MPDQSKLLLVESIIPPGNEPDPAKFIDMIMLLMAGGRERTEAEYRSLLRSNGFELTRVIPTGIKSMTTLTAFAILSGIFWTVAYLLIIQRSIQDKSVGMPGEAHLIL